jgi:hypothetical protein
LAVSARRIAVDFARRSATRTSYQTAAGAEVPVVENPGPTDENLRAVIRGALDGLPAEQRVVFEHKVLKGRTLEEIARLESISLNTAASRLRYALDKIRGQLRPYYDDLNRSQFKNMKNDLNQDLSENKRIITPLEPKRVPSVVPGLEGLAALSADSGVSDAPTPEVAECYALPTVEAPAPEFVEPQIHIDPFFVPPPTGGIDPIPETCWEETAPEIVDGGNGELPELVICEMFPPDGQIPTEWLKPLELPKARAKQVSSMGTPIRSRAPGTKPTHLGPIWRLLSVWKTDLRFAFFPFQRSSSPKWIRENISCAMTPSSPRIPTGAPLIRILWRHRSLRRATISANLSSAHRAKRRHSTIGMRRIVAWKMCR